MPHCVLHDLRFKAVDVSNATNATYTIADSPPRRAHRFLPVSVLHVKL
jgi:hypothetical protein